MLLLHNGSELLKYSGSAGCLFFSSRTIHISKSLKDDMDKILKKRKTQRLCTDSKLNLYQGFCVPYTRGRFVHTSEMYTSYNASLHSYNVEPWSRGCDDVTVWFFLCQLNRLLLFENQEAVELRGSLLSVGVST